MVSRCSLKQRMMEMVVTAGAIGRAKLQSNHYHQQTNTKSFLPCVPYIHLVTYRCTEKFQDICKIFRIWSKFQDISGQLLKFQEFQDNAQVCFSFAFLVSRPPQSALHCQAPTLLLNRWLACLTGSSILVLKLTFSPDPSPVTFLSL